MGHVTANREGAPPVTLAVCDVDSQRRERALKKTGRGAEAYGDWRKVIERKDIDTIHIGTPPHWHALMTIAAMQAGKDVFCEKPMTRFLREGMAVVEAVKRYGRVYTINSYSRTSHRTLRKITDSGLLGGPLTVIAGPNAGYPWKVKMWSGRLYNPTEPVPEVLDYDMWLGPAPFKPYARHRTHGSFRGYWDYDGGGLGDMGQHYLDRIQYAINKDHDSPVEVEAYAPFPAHHDACGLWGNVSMKYADGTTLIIESGEWGETKYRDRPFIEGPKGKIYGGQGKITRTDPPDLLQKLAAFPEPAPMIAFPEAVKTRQQPSERPNAEAAHRSITLVHLANCAIRTGRKLRFDAAKQQFIGDAEANLLLDVPMRAPWHL